MTEPTTLAEILKALSRTAEDGVPVCLNQQAAATLLAVARRASANEAEVARLDSIMGAASLAVFAFHASDKDGLVLALRALRRAFRIHAPAPLLEFDVGTEPEADTLREFAEMAERKIKEALAVPKEMLPAAPEEAIADLLRPWRTRDRMDRQVTGTIALAYRRGFDVGAERVDAVRAQNKRLRKLIRRTVAYLDEGGGPPGLYAPARDLRAALTAAAKEDSQD